ncbi:uncharacterized protein PHACADRAFT_172257 [Phanerochaete carnosa HHB-10118-sp]|uniref:K Homology domain-containing protein n=1 Tax=Phanerochaete carnosa (strain HHB-10118-sp) TaxID=650164 RepID=K5WC62_PHACS|nr:uncharacterized protein PHACADRAFT_172257 [Phanerochaete carnosa HHB-10118-sp]EKM56589.1 hypothetical protein PHACADRAFT_172257 [Phanerochaete carnosa HHB-10118-sp]
MSSKRKWDQAAPAEVDSPAKAPKTDEGKTASEAAAAAAAIAAKIAAQFANAPSSGSSLGPKDPHDGDFTHDIDINDVRNRYLLTKGATQTQIHEDTGASVSTKGVWYPDRTKANEKDPPLYLHISATTPEMLQNATDKVNELIALDMGSLVEDKKDRREKRKWPEEKIPVGLETIRNFNVRAKVVGPSGMFVKYIQQETGTRVQIKGIGSGFVDQETGQEHDEPMYIHVTGPDEGQVQRAKVLTEDLLEVVRQEYAKVKTLLQQQQMELHQAQAQYAAYSAYAGYAPPQPGAAPPPPPPGEQPPPPPDGSAPPSPGDQSGQVAGAPSASDTDAYAAYWAAYGYDVNSPEFKAWQAQQQQQYAQYYAQAGYSAATASAPGQDGAPAPPPSEPAPPPPPPE